MRRKNQNKKRNQEAKEEGAKEEEVMEEESELSIEEINENNDIVLDSISKDKYFKTFYIF